MTAFNYSTELITTAPFLVEQYFRGLPAGSTVTFRRTKKISDGMSVSHVAYYHKEGKGIFLHTGGSEFLIEATDYGNAFWPDELADVLLTYPDVTFKVILLGKESK